MRLLRIIGRSFPLIILFCLMIISPLLCMQILRCGPTYYSKGYSENKFMSLRVGMTSKEVEAVMGPPLEKIPWQDGRVLWTYSDRDDDTCDFWRRWVLFKNDRVDDVVSDYWDD
jgi:hypothetical protein